MEHRLPLALGPRLEQIAGTRRSDVYRAHRRNGNAIVLPRWATVLGKIPWASKINGRHSVIAYRPHPHKCLQQSIGIRRAKSVLVMRVLLADLDGSLAAYCACRPNPLRPRASLLAVPTPN